MSDKFQKGMTVILNAAGMDCWERNESYKEIPPNEIMVITGTAGFDNGRDIYKVIWHNCVDYYFDYCLEEYISKSTNDTRSGG